MLILDTFNILHAAPRVHEQLRGLSVQTLIRLLEASRWSAGPVILACDGSGGRSPIDPAHSHPDAPIRVLYAGPGKDADTLIERLVIDAERRRGGTGRGLIVVSSDKGVLASAVGPLGPKPTLLSSEKFLHQLLADVSRSGGGAVSGGGCSESSDAESVSGWLARFGLEESPPASGKDTKSRRDLPNPDDLLAGFEPSDLDTGRWLGERDSRPESQGE